MIDTHAHLNFKGFDKDRDEVISRSFESGIKKIINIGTDLKESEASIKLAEKYENIYATVGIHPTSLVTRNLKLVTQVRKLRELARNNKVVAIGEIGLDYFSHSEKEIMDKQKKMQKEGFNEQLKLAKELNVSL